MSRSDKYDALIARIKLQPRNFNTVKQKYYYVLYADEFPELFGAGEVYRSKNRREEER